MVGVQVGYLLGRRRGDRGGLHAARASGRLILWAVFQRDYPLVQGTILFVSLLFMLSNLVVDLVYALRGPADPLW